jgi:hypothetical protein
MFSGWGGLNDSLAPLIPGSSSSPQPLREKLEAPVRFTASTPRIVPKDGEVSFWQSSFNEVLPSVFKQPAFVAENVAGFPFSERPAAKKRDFIPEEFDRVNFNNRLSSDSLLHLPKEVSRQFIAEYLNTSASAQCSENERDDGAVYERARSDSLPAVIFEQRPDSTAQIQLHGQMLRTPAPRPITGDSSSRSEKVTLSPSLVGLQVDWSASKDATTVQKLSSAMIAEYTHGSLESISQQGGTGESEAFPQLLEGLFSICLTDGSDDERIGTPPSAEEIRAEADSKSGILQARLKSQEETGLVTSSASDAEQPVHAPTYRDIILRVIRSIRPKDFGDILEALESMLPESVQELVEPLQEFADQAAEDLAAAQEAEQLQPRLGCSPKQGPGGSEGSDDENEDEGEAKVPAGEGSSQRAANAKDLEARIPVQDITAPPLYVPSAPNTTRTAGSLGTHLKAPRPALASAGGAGGGPDTPRRWCQSRLLVLLFGVFVAITGLATLALVGVLVTSSDCGCTCLVNSTYPS